MQSAAPNIIFSSKNEYDQNSEFVTHIKDTCGIDCTISHIHNPDGMSLSMIYADMMDRSPSDINIFIHDDIEFLRDGWGAEVVRLFDEHKDYGIIGVAGSAYFDEKAAWWQYDDKYGQVLHRHDGKSWLTAFSPLLDKDLQEVCVIDGLFMAVHRKRVTENFDRDLPGFDFYDINFCLSNFLKKKTKIGVTTNIRIAHNSIGEMRDTWYTSRDTINRKYQRYYPIKVRKGK